MDDLIREATNLYDLELLIKGQVSYVFELAHEGKMKEAQDRLTLTGEHMCQIAKGLNL